MNKSRPCRRCGGTSTVQTEGKLFCSTCSEQIEEFFEVEEDEDQMAGTMFARALKTPKVQKETRQRESGEEDEADLTTAGPSVPPKSARKGKRKTRLSTLETDLTQEYLQFIDDTERHQKDENIGLSSIRIGCFAKILCKMSTTMRVELGFPKVYPKQVHCILQRYLRMCGVAFIEEEYTENPEKMFKKIVLRKKTKKSIAENMKRLKLEKKKKGMKRLEKSQDVWELLQSTHMTENFELSSEDDELEQTKHEAAMSESQLEVVETKLGNEIKDVAERFYLEMDLVVAVLYTAALTTGCLWVTISDVVRWIREDRAKVFGQICRMNPNTSAGSGWVNDRLPLPSLTVPLYEFYRTSSWLHQVIEIDAPLLNLGYPQLVARYLYNLNLPTELMERVLVLMDCAPPSDTLDEFYFTQQGDVKEGSFNPKCPRQDHTIARCFGSAITSHDQSYAFISTETKILAYILLALKLFYGLDDKLEYEVKRNAFDPVEWIYQLKMRLMIWEGHAVSDVLNPTKVNYPLSSLPHVVDNKRLDRRSELLVLAGRYRTGLFETATPSVTPCESAIDQPNALAADVTDRSLGRNDEDMVYAPVRAQVLTAKQFMAEKRTDELKEKLNNEISAESYQTLVKDFGDCALRTSKNPQPVEGTYGNQRESTERCQTEEDGAKWRKLFPSASNYVKYPHPLWAQGMTWRGKETSSYHRRLNRRFGNVQRSMVGPRMMFLSVRGSSDLFTAAKYSFSANFAELLQLFSKSINEHHYILYAAYSMLETQIVDRSEYRAICERIVEGSTIPMSFLTRPQVRCAAVPEVESGNIRVSIDAKISEPRQLRWLRFGAPRDWGRGLWNDNDDDSEFGDSSESEADDEKIVPPSDDERTEEYALPDEGSRGGAEEDDAKEREIKLRTYAYSRLYDWTTFWRLLTMRYW